MATSRSEGARRNKAQQNEQVGLWASTMQRTCSFLYWYMQ